MLSCDTVQFALIETMIVHLISELRRLKKSLFDQLGNRVLIHSIEYKECATIICYAPHHIKDCV